ncbi:uncharacterized protein KZ484_016348 [Pholidichthys leucotaenia]
MTPNPHRTGLQGENQQQRKHHNDGREHIDNYRAPKVFSTRKISLSTGSKFSPGPSSTEGDQDSRAVAGRKRRWGSSMAVTAKKASISITTDSLKSLIPDIKPCLGQEAVVDLHPEESVLSGGNDEDKERSDQDFQIRRTVTQVVPSESQENGQSEVKRSRHEEVEEENLGEDGELIKVHEEQMDTSVPEATEPCSPTQTSHHVEVNTGEAIHSGTGTGRGRTSGVPSLLPERNQWVEREREMERRERARAEREWDRDKVREFGKYREEKEGRALRSRSRERWHKERGKSKERKEKTAEEPPAKLLDDLFHKTKAAPCIYWLPLTDEQCVQREAARAERDKEREKRRKELEEERKKREDERKERMKAGGGTTGERSEGGKDRDRGRDRDRDREREWENDKHRDGYRRPGGSGAGMGRRSRSRSGPRERRR